MNSSVDTSTANDQVTLDVVNIQRFSISDGPGIRSTIFLQGCPLTCAWCSNPESRAVKPQLMFNQRTCIECGICAEVCPTDAIDWTTGAFRFTEDACVHCLACEQRCPAGSIVFSSHPMTIEAILAEVGRDVEYYADSGGGVTVSGGEPLLQRNATALLRALHEAGHHVMVETTANISPAVFEASREWVDHYYVDLKHPDPGVLHDEVNGRLSLIMANLSRLAAEHPERLTVRIPVIPRFNDAPETIDALYRMVLDLGLDEVHLLGFHPFGANKYSQLGLTYRYADTPRTDASDLAPLVGRAPDGLQVTVVG